MFRHYCFILRELVVSTLSSYTYISDEAVGNTIYNYVILILQYTPGQRDDSVNIQIVCTATTQT